MIERGPYVRFVWTLSADDCLDHHPEEGNRLPWDSHQGRGWLRVERQVTVPFPGVESRALLDPHLPHPPSKPSALGNERPWPAPLSACRQRSCDIKNSTELPCFRRFAAAPHEAP